MLTHWGQVTHICVSKVRYLWFRYYRDQCWNIVNWTLGNKLQWNLNRNLYIFIQRNVFEIIVRKLVAILSRPWCVRFDYIHRGATWAAVEWRCHVGHIEYDKNGKILIGRHIYDITWSQWKAGIGCEYIQTEHCIFNLTLWGNHWMVLA